MLSRPNILVCTDFSVYSNAALKVAENLRKRTNGHLEVIHISEHKVIWDWILDEGATEKIEAGNEFHLLKTLQKSLDQQMEMFEIKGESHVISGLPSAVIIQEIIDKKIDIVVMGHKGRTGLNFHLGSLAQKIVATSPVPVLVIKKQTEINKIACLIDPKALMRNLLTWSEELSFILSSQLTVISLFPDIAARFFGYKKIGVSTELLALTPEEREKVDTEIKEKIKKEMDGHSKADLRVEISTEKKLCFHLNSILEESKIDLAIMKRHQSDFIEKILIGSETRRMLEIFKGNLLILPPTNE